MKEKKAHQDNLCMEFHVSRKARAKYGLEDSLFSLSGNVILTNIYAVRKLAQKMNEKRDLKNHPEQTIKAGQLNAMGLIDEILHFVVGVYRQQKNPEAFKNALRQIEREIGTKRVKETLWRFVELFPPLLVYKGVLDVKEYIEGETGKIPNSQITCEELLLLFLANNNPAFLPFKELFDDMELYRSVPYQVFIDSLIDFFKTQPTFGPKNQFLVDLLTSPVKAAPYSLAGQLEFIRDNWWMLLPPEIMYRILLALDLLKEEEWLRGFGPGPSLVLSFKELDEYEEYEAFSKDLDWMSNVVMIAKHTYVWMDQLSKKYKRPITRLDHIPDEELDTLARWGFNALWLIGLWERSPASRTIKQLCGNLEAMASPYSIYDYVIAQDLGGEEAFENLKARAWQRGIRLVGDMVPNHVGIYSKWVIEHPDWFIQLDYPPFPSYSFNGPNLSFDGRVGIYIEDGYWTRRDAAVVFKRVDHWTGDVRYIYHGNDGTNMPWNDTAQLNFLRADVREAVIQTILHVARKFPIIRFDAAMTLTKRHYQRLWFPPPGAGGAIPSRAGLGMSREEFNRLFPKEFWREVVDRVAKEAPDTLLLAEAFWLMEGYFVRTLGMHRVYNSAFMNMLKMEENANYRSVMKNVLEFNPQILKRFVNFMNNPDEETAVAQFGKGDKYFGVAIMMVTMPGLPMFGHGQIEGFAEKYGMEYRRAYWNEEVDWNLVRRHEAEVFPLMRKRYLFSGVENFVLYDCYTEEGWVNEDVFAYSNQAFGEKALIVYNNRYAHAKGWIKHSVGFSVEGDCPGERKLIQKTLAEALNIKNDPKYYYIFRDYKSGLEYIRQGKELAEKGLYIDLGAYQYHVFLDFQEVYDHDGYWERLNNLLNGKGVPSIEEAYKEILLEPILTPFRQLTNNEMLKNLVNLGREKEAMNVFETHIHSFLLTLKEFTRSQRNIEEISKEVMSSLEVISTLEDLEFNSEAANYLRSFFPEKKEEKLSFFNFLLSWAILSKIGKIKTHLNYEQQSVAWIDELFFGKVVIQNFQKWGCNDYEAKRKAHLLKILTAYQNWAESEDELSALKRILEEGIVGEYLHFNWYDGELWFNKEAFEELMYWLFVVSIINASTKSHIKEESISKIISRYEKISKTLRLGKESGYRVKVMLEKMMQDKSSLFKA